MSRRLWRRWFVQWKTDWVNNGEGEAVAECGSFFCLQLSYLRGRKGNSILVLSGYAVRRKEGTER